MSNILKPRSTSQAIGGKDAPFAALLSQTGAGVTFNLAADWSGGSASTAYWIAPMDAVVCMFTISIGDNSVAQNASAVSRLVPDGGTGAINLGVYNSSDVLVQDLWVNGVGSLSLTTIAGLSSYNTIVYANWSATASNNEFMSVHHVNFVKKCGGGIFVEAGNRFGFPLTNNWSTANVINCMVSGFFRG